MVEFRHNEELDRWEMVVKGEIILTWEGQLAKTEIDYWKSYAEAQNRKAIERFKRQGVSQADLQPGSTGFVESD